MTKLYFKNIVIDTHKCIYLVSLIKAQFKSILKKGQNRSHSLSVYVCMYASE